MMSKPAHTVIGDVGKPGQIVNKDTTWDVTLADYIARKSKHDALTQVNNEKKLTFEEWWEDSKDSDFWSEKDIARSAWAAAKEN